MGSALGVVCVFLFRVLLSLTVDYMLSRFDISCVARVQAGIALLSRSIVLIYLTKCARDT